MFKWVGWCRWYWRSFPTLSLGNLYEGGHRAFRGSYTLSSLSADWLTGKTNYCWASNLTADHTPTAKDHSGPSTDCSQKTWYSSWVLATEIYLCLLCQTLITVGYHPPWSLSGYSYLESRLRHCSSRQIAVLRRAWQMRANQALNSICFFSSPEIQIAPAIKTLLSNKMWTSLVTPRSLLGVFHLPCSYSHLCAPC